MVDEKEHRKSFGQQNGAQVNGWGGTGIGNREPLTGRKQRVSIKKVSEGNDGT